MMQLILFCMYKLPFVGSNVLICLPRPLPDAGVSGLETKNAGKTQTYALLVADTVVVKAGGAAPEVLTAACTKGWSDVAYFFKVTVYASCPSCFCVHQLKVNM